MQSHEKKHKQDASGIVSATLSLVSSPLKPLIPRLLPLLVLLLSIPLLGILSGAAGWMVWTSVPSGWAIDAFLQYGDTSIPFANVQLPQISANQPYDISLHLVVPATESNYALGNFMATLELSTAYNDPIITVRRPVALVRPRSSLVKQALLGAPATATLDVPLLSQFVPGTSSVKARLELGRSDSWKSLGDGQGRELSVAAATLKGRVRPRGIFALLMRYPRLATFFSTFTFFFIAFLVVSCLLFVAVRSDSSSKLQSKGYESGSEDEGYGYPPSGSRRDEEHFSEQKFSEHEGPSDFSAPEDGIVIQDAEGSQTSLRRRRSNLRAEQVRVKIEDMPIRRGTTSPLYPKSPYPRQPSIGSDSSLHRHGEMIELMMPSDVNAES